MKSKKYIAIAKIRNNKDCSVKCVKYRFDNLLKFTEFLDRKWSEWKWYNVFSNKGHNKKTQIANYTNRNRPAKKLCLMRFVFSHHSSKKPLQKMNNVET